MIKKSEFLADIGIQANRTSLNHYEIRPQVVFAG
jgi:hypothetical protein